MSRATSHYNNYVILKLFKKNIMHICKKIEVRPLLTIFFCLWNLSMQAQSTRKYSNAFMDIGVNAAALGMANAVVSNTSDINATYWNPAGLTQLESKQMALMHANYFANIANYNFLAYGMPIDDDRSIGVSIIRFGVDDILDTTQLIDENGNINYDRISRFSNTDYAITMSYAKRLPMKGFSYGINAKVIRRIIGDYANSWGFGFDLGIQFQSKSNWKFGAMVRDITTTYNSWTINEAKFNQIRDAVDGENQSIPEGNEITIPKLQLGLSKTFNFNYDYKLTAALDAIVRFEQTSDIISNSFASVTPALGLEFSYIDMIYARAGVGNFQNELNFDDSTSLSIQPNIGLGFKFKGIQLDYALTNIGNQSESLYSNVFSLVMDFSIFK